MSRTSRFSDKFLVRLPEGMRDRLAESAARNHRTLTAEVAHRLQESLDGTEVDAGGVVLRLTITPGMTIENVLDLLEAAHLALPEDSRLVVD